MNYFFSSSIFSNSQEFSRWLYVEYDFDANKFILRKSEDEEAIEFYVLGSEVKNFTKGQPISGSLTLNDKVNINLNSFTSSQDFYVGFRINTCDNSNNNIGWIRLKYDDDCNSLTPTAMAVNGGNTISAGQVSEPTLLFSPELITKDNNGDFDGFEIEIMQSNTSQIINPSITDNNNNFKNYL